MNARMTQHVDGPAPVPRLGTAIASVELRELTARDSSVYLDLVQRNRGWLTRYGDYQDLVNCTLPDIESDFAKRPNGALRMGIWRGKDLMGRVDVAEVAPGAFVLGYWLGEEYTGHGYMTEACRVIMDYASRTRLVKEYWAGVRHVNLESIAVVERLGFSVYERLPERNRYRLVCPP